MKNILIGISGGIAAYKIPGLIRLFIKNKYNVKIIITENGKKFVTKDTLQTLSKNKIYDTLFSNDIDIDHISLKDWADVFVVAPATANIIGKYANAIADDLLSTVLLSFKKEIFFVPSMNTDMFNNVFFKNNIEKIKKLNPKVSFLEPDTGDLACGISDKGRMPEINNIYNFVIQKNIIIKNDFYKNKTVLLTAGPTKEYIDPVRYISNDSSGKQGIALTKVLLDLGAKVILIKGEFPISIAENKRLKIIDIISAREMFKEVKNYFKKSDIFISCSAVADYTPLNKLKQKIKKNNDKLELKLTKNPDILQWAGLNKTKNQIIVGFAAETENLNTNALKKLKKKKCDFIVANLIKNSIGKSTNKISVFTSTNKTYNFKKLNKIIVAEKICSLIAKEN